MNLFTQTQRESNTSSQPSSPASVEAAQRAEDRADYQMNRYLTALYKAGQAGLTDHEAAAALGIQNTTVCARRGSETGKRYVYDAGTRRPGPFGNTNTVWVHRQHAGPDAKPQKGAVRG